MDERRRSIELLESCRILAGGHGSSWTAWLAGLPLMTGGRRKPRRSPGGWFQALWDSLASGATMLSYGIALGAIMMVRGGEIEVAKFFAYPVLLANAPAVAMGLVLTALLLFLGIDIRNNEILWWWMAFAAPFVYPYWRWMERGWRRYLVNRWAPEIRAEAEADGDGETEPRDDEERRTL